MPRRYCTCATKLDEQHEKLPLFDTAGWVRHLETLLEQLLSD